MSILVGKKAPSFSAQAVVNGGEFVEGFSLEQFVGENPVLFFFYPKDFTFVCPTELFAFQNKLAPIAIPIISINNIFNKCFMLLFISMLLVNL